MRSIAGLSDAIVKKMMQRYRLQQLKKYKGKLVLDIDLNATRSRDELFLPAYPNDMH